MMFKNTGNRSSHATGPLKRPLMLALFAFMIWAAPVLAGEDPTSDINAQRRARAEAWLAEQETRLEAAPVTYRLAEDGRLVSEPVDGELPPAGADADDPPLEADLGGEDILIEANVNYPEPKLEITSTGIIYIAVARRSINAGFEQLINIYRSDDGGRTFTLWSVFDDPSPAGIYYVADFVIAEGASDRAFLAYRLGNFLDDDVRVAWAELSASSPTWNYVTALPADTAILGEQIDLETDAESFSEYYLYLAATGKDGGGAGVDIWFTRSTDMGVTWETGYKAASHPEVLPASAFAPILSYGNDGYLHMVYMYNGFYVGNLDGIMHTRAANFADGGAAGWSDAIKLRETAFEDHATLLTVEASQVDGTVLVHFSENPGHDYQGTVLKWSTDNGATWPATNEVAVGIDAFDRGRIDIDPATGSVWILGHNRADQSSHLEIQTQGTTLTTPGVLSAPERWSGQDLEDFYTADNDMAHDPSRGNRRAVVWQIYRDGLYEVYFDAEWHRDPGWPITEAGFPIPVGGNGRTPPAIANVDADPYGEIIFATEEGLIYVVNHDGTIADGWPIGLNEDIPWDAPVAIGDLNGDDEPEIVVGTVAGRVFAFHPDGTIVSGWPVDLGTNADTFVSIGALGPPYPRYVVACSGNVLKALKNDGEDMSPLWGTAVTEYLRPAAIGDVDGDGVGEIIIRQLGYIHVKRLDSNTAQAFRFFPGETLSGMPALVDIDFDGDLEIAVGTIEGKVYLMHHDLTDYSPVFPYDTGNDSPVMGVVPVNLLGNFTPELVFSQLDGTTHIVFEDGNPGLNYPNYSATNDFVYMPPIVTNVYGPSPDVVLSAGTSLYCWENLGAVPDGWPREMEDFMEESVAAGDIDLDGNIEIVALGLNELRVMDVGTPPGEGAPHLTWPMYAFNAQRTGCLDCVENVVSAVDDPLAPSPTRLAFAPPYPNPASARTAFSYALPAAAHVKLQIFDVRGRLVHTLADGQQEAGHHEAFWNGKGSNGRRVALGLYLAKLAVSGPGVQEERVRKISLVR